MLWVGLVLAACAQTPVAEPIAKDLREETLHLRVTVKDLKGRQETREIPVTAYRPAGAGPFPLVIMNHGRAPADKRATQGRPHYLALARYLVGKGFAVFIPTRVGYADTYGDFDPEAAGTCKDRQLEPMSLAASDQVLATLALATTLPDIDTSRWLVMGQSVGGLASVTTTWRHPPGLMGAINFAGGAGGNPERSPGRPCRPQDITAYWGSHAAEARVPMLWLYWQNDLYWGPDNPKRWHQAWVKGGGQAEMHTLPAVGTDGHGGIGLDMDHWVPLAEAFLVRLGFTQPGLIARPPATSFAALTDIGKVPSPGATRVNSIYRKFLEARAPRAFAIGATGASGWAQGDWAMGRALGYCQQRGDVCSLYAVDDDVVWVPPP